MKTLPLVVANIVNIILLLVVVAVAEIALWSTIDGLKDVAKSLPKTLARHGHKIMLVASEYFDSQDT